VERAIEREMTWGAHHVMGMLQQQQLNQRCLAVGAELEQIQEGCACLVGAYDFYSMGANMVKI
jgi:CO dehydrogenase nickel-insertion accessory protein CooC1